MSNYRPDAGSRRTAFSLLEVAIALAIFVIGALAIVRIFPTALGIIQGSGTKQVAFNLNRATIARYNSNPAGIPRAIYDTNISNGEWQDYQGAVLATSRLGNSLPYGKYPAFDTRNSALSHFRNISGEGTSVQGDDGGNLFLFTQFPIFSETPVSIYEECDVDGVQIDASGNLNFQNATIGPNNVHIADTTNPTLPITALRYDVANASSNTSYPVTYYVSYSYKVTGGYTGGVLDEPTIIDPADTTTKQVNQTSNVIPGTVAVKMRRRVALITFNTTDPIQNDDQFRGIVSNFTGQLYSSSNLTDINTVPTIVAGDKVEVDYQADWSRLIEEGIPNIVPQPTPTGSTTPRQLALGVPYLEDHNIDAIAAVMMVPSSGGIKLEKSRWGEGPGAAAATGVTNKLLNRDQYLDTDIDFRDGKVTFETNGAAGAKARVAFLTRDFWTQQLSVAAESYKPFNSDKTELRFEPWRDYVLDGSILHFHTSEAGKSVLVSYTYDDGTTNSPIVVKDKLIVIDTPIEQSTSLGGFTPGYTDEHGVTVHGVADAKLTDTAGNDLAAGNLKAILSVRGASMAVRTAFLNSNDFSQAYLTTMRSDTGAATS